MYVLLLFALLGTAYLLVHSGLRRGRRYLVWAGALLGTATALLFAGMDLWGEALWFGALGYGPRFWTILGAQATTTAAGALTALVLVSLLNTPARRVLPAISPWVELVGPSAEAPGDGSPGSPACSSSTGAWPG
jgi:hypothetical protein